MNQATLVASWPAIRFNLKNWLAVEGDYDYFRNHETFRVSSRTTFGPMNTHAVTGTAIVTLPSFRMPAVKVVSPFVLGGGAQCSTSHDRDLWVTRHEAHLSMEASLTCRCQDIFWCAPSIGVLSTRPPDFEQTNLKVDKYTHSAVPSVVGLVYTF